MNLFASKHSVSVAAIIFNDNKQVLAIQRRDNNKWEPPGGVLERNETIQEGLMREVKEETGLTIIPETLSGIYQNMPQGIIALVFHCALPPDQQPQTNTNEAQQIRWLTINEAKNLMDEVYTIRILDTHNQTPNIRAHNGTHLLPNSP